MSNQKKRSFRFDSTDLVRSVGIWRSPEILNAVTGNIIGLFIVGVLVYFGFLVAGNFAKSSKIRALADQCELQMLQAGTIVPGKRRSNRRYCFLKAKVTVNRSSSK